MVVGDPVCIFRFFNSNAMAMSPDGNLADETCSCERGKYGQTIQKMDPILTSLASGEVAGSDARLIVVPI